MDRIKLVMDERFLTAFLTNLLCLKNNQSLKVDTIDESLKIHFIGDNKTIQKTIYEWLNIPERKATFNTQD